jgi:hypothetical protein
MLAFDKVTIDFLLDNILPISFLMGESRIKYTKK